MLNNINQNQINNNKTDIYLVSRAIALHIFSEVLTKNIFIEEALRYKQYLQANNQDKSFIRNLVSTSFRFKFKIDYVLNKFINENTNQQVKNLLTLALTEIMVFNTPHYAVVNSYVELCKTINLCNLSKLVNAVLKKVCKEYKNILQRYDYSNNWLFNRWQQEYGKEIAIKICDSLEQRHPLDLIFNDAASLDANKHLGIVMFCDMLRINQSISVTDINGYNEGKFWVQGASSFVAIQTLRNNIIKQNVADLCSAPGGKTFLIKQLEAKIIKCFDISLKRFELMVENLKRLNLSFKFEDNQSKDNNHVVSKSQDSQIILYNKNILKLTPNDLKDSQIIILDVPCLATGTIRKHPEVMYLKSPQKLKEIIAVQKEMLNHIANIVAKGSIILYSNCSLQQQEGEYLVNDFLAKNKNFKLEPFTQSEVFNCTEFIDNQGYLRILPYHHLANAGGMEGFFAAKLVKL